MSNESQYKVGDVENGHMWNGTTWVPVTDAPPAARPWYKKKRYIILGAIAVLVIIIAATSSGSSDDETAAPAPSDGATIVPAPSDGATVVPDEGEQAEPDVPGVGDPVRDGKFEFTVTSIETGVTSVGDGDFLTAEPQGTFTLVNMTVANIGDEPQTFFDSNQEGVDDQGRELAPDTSAGLYANEAAQGFIEEINPGNSINVIVVFDVAAGIELASIIVHDSAFSDGVEVALR